MVERSSHDDDPPPLPPVAPTSVDCCRGGCDPCVFDLYDQELARYVIALRQWQERNGGVK